MDVAFERLEPCAGKLACTVLLLARPLRGSYQETLSRSFRRRVTIGKRPETVGISGAGSAAPDLYIEPTILK